MVAIDMSIVRGRRVPLAPIYVTVRGFNGCSYVESNWFLVSGFLLACIRDWALPSFFDPGVWDLDMRRLHVGDKMPS